MFRTAVPGILSPDHLEVVKLVYQRFQETQSGAAIQGYSQAGRLSRPVAGIVKVGPALGGHTLNGSPWSTAMSVG